MNRSRGFTLIELLLVVAIVGVLAAIAVPRYAAYRQRSFDARAAGDLRNVAAAEEAYFADNSSYLDCDQTSCPGLLPGLSGLSSGVVLSIAASNQSFVGLASHPNGSGITCHWDSDNQGLIGCY